MRVQCNGTARIEHKASEQVFEIDRDELDWDAVDAYDRQMGPEIHYQAVLRKSAS